MSDDEFVMSQSCADGSPPVLTETPAPSAASALNRLQRFVDGETARTLYALPPNGRHDPMRADVQALIGLMVRWRIAAQKDCPGGSEYMDPAYFERFVQDRRERDHKTRIENILLRRAAQPVVDCWGVGSLNITAMGEFVEDLRKALRPSAADTSERPVLPRDDQQ